MSDMWRRRSVFANALMFLAVVSWAINASSQPMDTAAETSIALCCTSLTSQAIRTDDLAPNQYCLLWFCSGPFDTHLRYKARAVSEGQIAAMFAGAPLESVKFQV
jgi:hypothetical protein